MSAVFGRFQAAGRHNIQFRAAPAPDCGKSRENPLTPKVIGPKEAARNSIVMGRGLSTYPRIIKWLVFVN